MHGSGDERWIVTTPRKRPDLNPVAECTARRLGIRFVERGEDSFVTLFEREGAVAVYVETESGPLIQTKEGPIVFHEGTAALRTGKTGVPDALIRALDPKLVDKVLDATLGMASDSIVIATTLKGGKVTGIESNPLLADLVARGLVSRKFSRGWIREAAGRIEVLRADHTEFMRSCDDGSYDLVYFDPMFSEPVRASSSMWRMRQVADDRPLSDEAMDEARRVARRRIVVKGRRGFFGTIRFDGIVTSGKSIFYGIINV